MATRTTMAPVLARRFPHLDARDLQGTARTLPEAFDGDRNVVLIAFRARHQVLVDSWVPWLTERTVGDAGLRWFEVPTSSSIWLPVNRSIDRGMAGAVLEPEVRRRTLTVYGDRRRMTEAVGISDIATITIALVDRDGWIHWTGSGPFSETTAAELDAALAELATARRTPERRAVVEQFGFDFARMTRPALALIGVVPRTATVTVGPYGVEARFGPWTCATPIRNLAAIESLDRLPWAGGLGVRLSVPDCGLQFVSTTRRAVRLTFVEPVRGLFPGRRPRHSSLTVTVADPAGLIDALVRAGAPPPT